MDNDFLAGKWEQLKDQIQEQWDKLTDEELNQIKGHREVLLDKLQEKYGYSREEAERKLESFVDQAEIQGYPPSEDTEEEARNWEGYDQDEDEDDIGRLPPDW